jgi:HNH endonuclease
MSIKPLTRLLFAQGERCFFCEQPLSVTNASIEHLVASSNGGSNRDENCVACCKPLNQLLGSMSLKEKIQIVLNQKGQFKCPNDAESKIRETRSQTSPKATKVAERNYALLVINLKQRGNSKPRTLVKLKSMMAALFHNKLSDEDVEALVQQLQSRDEISVTGSKVTYS